MRAALHSVMAEHDTQGARRLGAANNADAGVLVAAVAPNLRRRFELSWALLEALGKRQDVSGAGKNDDASWEVLHAWLLAHRIAHVVLLDAQWLPPDLVEDVAGLVATCGLDVWLVAHHPVGQGYLDELKHWPHVEGGAEALVTAIGPALRGGTAGGVGATAPFPVVPPDNWPTFRDACRRTLTEAEFAIVDERYRAAIGAARAFFSQSDVSEAAVLAHLRSVLDDCASVGEMVTTIRATQVGAFLSGWVLQADPGRVLATAESMARAAVHSAGTWQALRAYRLPYRGASVALAAAQLTIGDMKGATCSNVASEGATITASGVARSLPAGAEVFLRAQLTWRAMCGASGEAELFADEQGPLRDRTLADALRAPALELGIPVPDLALRRAPDPVNERWRDRWGISIQRIPA